MHQWWISLYLVCASLHPKKLLDFMCFHFCFSWWGMSHGMRDFQRFSTSFSPCFWVDSSRWLKSLKPSSECQSLKTNRWNLKMGAPWKRRNMSQITQLFGGSMFAFQGVNWILLGRVTGDVLIVFCQCVWSLNSWYNLTRWWFQTCFIFIPTRGNDPIWLYNMFQMG